MPSLDHIRIDQRAEAGTVHVHELDGLGTLKRQSFGVMIPINYKRDGKE